MTHFLFFKISNNPSYWENFDVISLVADIKAFPNKCIYFLGQLWSVASPKLYHNRYTKTAILKSLLLLFSASVVSDSLWPHGPQHIRLPYPSPPPRACSNSCPLGDAIQPSHSLSYPSPPAINPSHHRGLFQWVSSSHQVAKVLEFQLQHQFFQWIFRTDFL